jgi:alginate O-acetyltransferase complex protein AlgJ
VSTNRLPQQYSSFFVLILLSSMLLTMVNSLRGGVAGFENNFPGKARLLSTFNYLRYSIGDKVFSQVLVGEDGWLEYTSNRNLEDYQNALLVPGQMESVHQKLDTLNKELTRRGITLVVVIAPNKATIYSDKISEKLKKMSGLSRLEIFLELTQPTHSSYVVDLRPALVRGRRNHQLYYKTDTHWNSLGAFIAYQEIMNTIAQVYPDLQPYGLDQFQWTETNPGVLDLARVMGADFIKESRNELKPKFEATSYLQKISTQSDAYISWGYGGQEKTLLMYEDSFGAAIRNFLQYHFKEAIYIPDTDPELSKISWINITHPDIVMIECVERDLAYLDLLVSRILKRLPRQN